MTRIGELTAYLENLAPLGSQVSYDNCGLLVGDKNQEVKGCLVCLDCTEDVVEDAIRSGCNLIVAHHPLIFTGIKSLTGKNYVERTIIKAIQNNIAIYAIHTNFDNYRFGVNYKIGELLGLSKLKILAPSENVLSKLSVFVPLAEKSIVLNAILESGAGAIGDYRECSFSTEGQGTYFPEDKATPFQGSKGERNVVDEVKIEVVVSNHVLSKVVKNMLDAHPYEEVAYDIVALKNTNNYEGSGMYGELETPMHTTDFLGLIKSQFNCGVIRHTELLKETIKTVAFCGGSGSFLLGKAKSVNADIFITADYKYHDFFDAEKQIVIADIGHFESEQYTTNLLADILTKKFPTFVVLKTRVITNPIKYF